MTRLFSLVIGMFLVPVAFAQESETETPTRHEFTSLQYDFVADRVISGLSQPVAIDFLPSGKALVAQRNAGIISIIDFKSSSREDIQGLPKMTVFGDAGIHDIELHPGFSNNGWVYVSYSEGREEYSTVVLDRFRLDGTKAKDRERLFTADAYTEAAYHQGGRIQIKDGFVFLSIGDRQHPEMAQDRSNHVGTVVRLHEDGKLPDDNPFVGEQVERGDPPRPEIWSYGHRNPQGLKFHPDTNELWSNEHGPRGGDEVNLVTKGSNYGWATASFGLQYDGGPVGMGITWKEGFELPLWVYVPSIAPSDLLIYQGEAFSKWQGSFLIGALGLRHLNRLVIKDGAVVAEERLAPTTLGRIRAVAEDQKGLIYLGTDDGAIWRLSPAK